MKTLIYICPFYKQSIIEMAKLLLKSLSIYGNVNNNTDVLIYTEAQYKIQFDELNLDKLNIKYEFNNETKFRQARFRRYDIFNLEISKYYDRFLYLDVDILIGNDINTIIDLCKMSDIQLHTSCENHSIKNRVLFKLGHTWHGSFYFKNEKDKSFWNQPGLCSGVLLFNNNDKIKDLFNTVLIEEEKNGDLNTGDQTILCYFSWKSKLFKLTLLPYIYYIWYDCEKFKKIKPNIINHFIGGVGRDTKLIDMIKFIQDHNML